MNNKIDQKDDEDRAATRGVVLLGFVSFLNDLSSEVVARVLPLYLLSVVGAGIAGIGIVEAIADGTTILAKLGSGYFSDLMVRRMPFVFGGYALSVLSRPMILLQPSLISVSLARFFDKVGKGIRTAPRDALISDFSNSSNRGYHFGINRSMDTFGAVLGLLGVALYLGKNPSNQTHSLSWIIGAASVAGVLALFALGAGIHEPRRHRELVQANKIRLKFSELDARLRTYLWIALILALATSSDAFLIVRASDYGLSLRDIFFLLAAFNVVSAVSAYYLSSLSDKWGRKSLLIAGWLLYGVVYLVLGWRHVSLPLFVVALCVYGLFYGLTEGIEKALVADFEPSERTGQAYGWLGIVQALGVIPANLIFAFIYKSWGAQWAFWFSSFFAFLGAICLVFFKNQRVRF